MATINKLEGSGTAFTVTVSEMLLLELENVDTYVPRVIPNEANDALLIVPVADKALPEV